ncbi:MAG: hypothetical protein H6577_05890 [Lewinellaceae bacterium]|nr:hypothetical protein [Lewinellaceae bacterium]
MQNNPLYTLGESIRREYDSWLLADVVEGMEAFFETAVDARRMGGEFLPGLFFESRTGQMLRVFTAGFVPEDLFASGQNEGVESEGFSKNISTSNRQPDPHVPKQEIDKLAIFNKNKNRETPSSTEFLPPLQPGSTAPNPPDFPIYENQKIESPNRPKPDKKLTEYLSLLNAAAQEQPAFFEKNQPEEQKEVAPNSSPEIEKTTLQNFEKPKESGSESGKAAIPAPLTSHPPPLTSNSYQSLKTLNDFARLFKPQDGADETGPNLNTESRDDETPSYPISPKTKMPEAHDYRANTPHFTQQTTQPQYLKASPNKENEQPLTQPQPEPPDLDDIMDELTQRLTKEYRRFYG